MGTGFHTELTGRENIYLNGAINGMNKKEIDKKLDEIVDFAGVEKFLDKGPLKNCWLTTLVSQPIPLGSST